MDTFIVDAIRTPIGAIGGSLASVRPDNMAAMVIAELLKRNSQIPSEIVGEIILGCANQAGEDNRNVARMAGLLAGLPYMVPAETINRLCASGMSAVVHGHRTIQTAEHGLVICGGVESMTRAPYVLSKTAQPYGRDAKLFDTSFGWRFINPALEEQYGCDSMGQTAENLAFAHSISRMDQDQFAFWSQHKTKLAQESGRLAKEILPITIFQAKNQQQIIDSDDFPKPNTTVEGLAKLKPAFSSTGTVTAGNSSGLNDGACAVLLANHKMLVEYSLKPMAKILSTAVVGVEPKFMGIGPVGASLLALERAKLSISDIDIIEMNEAFAAQVLACTRALNLSDDDVRLNPNGGAISLGHPLGMTGARLIQTASLQLQLSRSKYALCTMCVGVGQGYAVVLENVS